MNEIVGSLFKWINKNPPQSFPVTDPTTYRVETITHSYIGQILFQDDMHLKLKVEGPRIIKVLKQNVKQIIIVRSEEHSQPQKSRL